MIEIVETTVADKIAHVGELLLEHWRELATNPGLMALKIDVARYAAMEQAGVLFALVAYDDRTMVGYSVNLIARHIRYSDLVYAENDVLFVSKAHRTGRTGMRLIEATEHSARSRGARMCLWHAKEGTDLQSILPRRGYRVQDVIFSKEL